MTEPVGDAGPSSFLDSLGARSLRRAEPRTSIAVAGAGCALGILGVLVIAGDTGIDETSGDFNRFPGIILSALVVAAGYFVLAAMRTGAIATAGSVAASLGVPPLLFFLTFDEGAFPPYSTEGILFVSTGVWLASYVLGPGRGRPFFLSAGLIGLWFSVLELVENLFEAPFNAFGFFLGASSSGSYNSDGESFGGSGGFDDAPSFDVPDPSTIGVLSLAFGVGFLLAGRWLDRRGHRGTATPFAVATLPCLFVGVLTLTEDLEQAGTGLLALLVGLGLAYHGATVWRRLTTWLGGAVAAIGVATFLADMTDDASIGGMLFIAGGIALIFLGHAVAAAIDEPDEMAVTRGLATVGNGPMRQVSTPPEEPPTGAPEAAEETTWAPPASPPVPPPPPAAPPAPPVPPPPPPAPAEEPPGGEPDPPPPPPPA